MKLPRYFKVQGVDKNGKGTDIFLVITVLKYVSFCFAPINSEACLM